MKKEFILFVLFIAAILFLTESCKLATDPEENNDIGTQKGVFKISGVVVDSSSGDPIETAIVKLIGDDTTYVIRTDADGVYSTEISIGKAIDFYVTASKEGYYARTVQITATADDNKQMPPFQLRPFFNLPDKSGDPASINLFSLSDQSISVKEAGGVESSQIIFEVRDSSGIPLDLDHKTTVYFKLGGPQLGNEYLFPDTAKTNGKGQVTVTLNSGTVSGVVQVVAELQHDGKIIKSKPIPVSIESGLPDAIHFSMAMSQHNLPGLIEYGFISEATAFVADKYYNPVQPGTVVYFTTTGGYIQPSGVTNKDGQVTVNLFTAAPQPTDPGNGIGRVTASTRNENGELIEAHQPIVFSGGPIFGLSPETFDIPNGGAQNFTLNLADINGNPLAANTSVSIQLEGSGAELTGNTDFEIADQIQSGYGSTIFTFGVQDSDPDQNEASIITIKIEVTILLAGGSQTTVVPYGGIVH